ncbi:MAG: siphovirus Gp157 family protein [Clostridia bacterium]
MESLYEISSKLANLEFVDMETGEVNEEMLNDLEMSFSDKAKNIALFIKNLNADAKAIKEEEKSLAERRKAKENKIDALERYLLSMIELTNKSKLEFAECVISTRKSTFVEVDEKFVQWANDNAKELLVYKEPNADKAAIKEAIKSGEKFEFARIVENINLSIK